MISIPYLLSAIGAIIAGVITWTIYDRISFTRRLKRDKEAADQKHQERQRLERILQANCGDRE